MSANRYCPTTDSTVETMELDAFAPAVELPLPPWLRPAFGLPEPPAFCGGSVSHQDASVGLGGFSPTSTPVSVVANPAVRLSLWATDVMYSVRCGSVLSLGKIACRTLPEPTKLPASARRNPS